MQAISTLRRQGNWFFAFTLLGVLSMVLVQNAFGLGMAPVYAQTIPDNYYAHGRRVVMFQNSNDDEDESNVEHTANGNWDSHDKHDQGKSMKENHKKKGNSFVHTDVICAITDAQYQDIQQEYQTWLKTQKVKKSFVEFVVVNGKGHSLKEFKQSLGLKDCVVVRRHHLWYLLFNTVEIS